ncbi:MAG TPA: S8 family serine peptidase [Gemmataceae bacterium]|nr:S8 family serine peptidase [Gemmataceae bacterium]
MGLAFRPTQPPGESAPVFEEPVEPISGVAALWAETQGDPTICVAVIDGPVDRSHPSLCGANLVRVETLASGSGRNEAALQHGTFVASLIFGQHPGPPCGIAPHCRGLLVPIFGSEPGQRLAPCSQLDLARAIALAAAQGAQVINVSAGQFTPPGAALPLLVNVVRACAKQGILIVAATGNEGCECLHVPAALDAVLAVGAMDAGGRPLAFSNWGGPYQRQGILAPGDNIVGALPGGGVGRRSGTSFATALVTGVAALLLSVQKKRGLPVNPLAVRAALLHSALGCEQQPIADCRHLLAGRLNVKGAVSLLTGDVQPMSETSELASSTSMSEQIATTGSPASSAVGAVVSQGAEKPCSCGCQAAAQPSPVYALGRLNYDLVSEARLDSLAQKMAAQFGATAAERVQAFNPSRLLEYLDANPWDAAAVEWTLHLDGTPIYAIRPQGPFAAGVYEQLRAFLRQQLTEGVERVSIPGVVSGKASLLLGQVVPVIVPERRGMYSWSTDALVAAVAGAAPAAEAPQDHKDAHEQKKKGIRDFLDRVYHELRNLGIMAEERALNFAATNAFAAGEAFTAALKERMELDSVRVVRSPVCRPSSDCWDVELYFFYPERHVQTVRKVYRFTVDVSESVPVTIGPVRSWFCR